MAALVSAQPDVAVLTELRNYVESIDKVATHKELRTNFGRTLSRVARFFGATSVTVSGLREVCVSFQDKHEIGYDKREAQNLLYGVLEKITEAGLRAETECARAAYVMCSWPEHSQYQIVWRFVD